DTPAADLAVVHEPLEGLHRLGQRIRAAPMQKIKVEPIGLEAPQGALAGSNGASARGIMRIDLADEIDAIARAGNRVANDLFGATLAVHFGGVDQAHAELEPELQRLELGGALALALAHAPGAEAEHGNFLSGLERH